MHGEWRQKQEFSKHDMLLSLWCCAFVLSRSFRLPNMALEAIPLDFVFKGYSIWLELSQNENDLDDAVDAAARDLDVHRIPAPHVTVLYGMTHLSENQILCQFREELVPNLQSWPDLRVKGFKVDKSFDGVDGQEMDMAWMEVEFETTEAHEELVDFVYKTFAYDGTRVRPWEPHVSIAYENPDIAKVNLDYAIKFMERYPTLISQSARQVTGVSLWKTEGKMESWKCLDRYELMEAAVEIDPAR